MDVYAKKLMRMDFKIVPLARPKRCVPKSGKAPLSRHGVKDATNNFAAFKRLIPADTNFNIGVATGSASGVVVIDIDPRNGGDREFARLLKQLGPLPKTLTCNTGGGGQHHYFKLPAGGLRAKKLAPGVDLLAEGSYAVAAPSRHASGLNYLWAQNPKDQLIASLPDKWLQFARNGNPVAQAAPKTSDADIIPEGSRNTELTRMAGRMRRAGMSDSDMIAALGGVNDARCHPPLGDGEVARIARNVAQYAVGAEPRDEGQKLAQAVLDAKFGGGLLLRYELDGRFWSWTGTHWAVAPDKMLQQKILNVVNKSPSARSGKTLVQEVFGLLQIMQARDDDMLHFASEPPNVVNVKNGELWLVGNGTIKLRPHDPATGMRHVLNVSFNPKARCPQYDAAIRRIFEKAEHPQTLIDFFNELMGYAIQPRRDIPLIVVMVGKGGNGKTSLVRTLTELVGANFIHSGRVDDLDNGRFAIGSLFGKMAFIDDDVRAGAKLPDGALKKISEAKLLTGEHKFKQAFNFINRAFPILLCNNLPSLPDLSPGIMRRLYVIPFDRTFEESEIDRSLFDRIIKNELSGVLIRALRGWMHLKKRGRFPRSSDMMRARKNLLAHANPLKGFIDECCEVDDKSKVTLEQFYHAYRLWAVESGYTMTQARSKVKENLEHQNYVVTRRNAGITVIGLKLR
jgi:P4 family phage/plasmid primase-like protien